MADVYSRLDGFPGREEQPEYYLLFDNLQSLVTHPETAIITARMPDGELLGCVIYFGDMKYYGSGGPATSIVNASGLRLLAVSPVARGFGIGRVLTEKCIALARSRQHDQVILHTTEYMGTAWALYEKMGFERYAEIDFLQGKLPVSGFRMLL